MEQTEVIVDCIDDELTMGKNVKKNPSDIGYDMVVLEDTIVMPCLPRTRVVLTCKVSLPEGMEGQVRPRSGFSLYGIEGYPVELIDKKEIRPRDKDTIVVQSEYRPIMSIRQRFDADVKLGTIDPHYPDYVAAIVESKEPRPFLIAKGTRIAQMVFNKVEHPTIKRGTVTKNNIRQGGFGTTGTN